MDLVSKSWAQLREAITKQIVFGEPVEREGVTVIPAATVFGGGGFGAGEEPKPDGPSAGGGGGYGVAAWPAGAFEITDGQVKWHRSFDATRVAVTAIFFGAMALRAILAARRD
jgi:uncharacterized spore protein YtfJ